MENTNWSIFSEGWNAWNIQIETAIKEVNPYEIDSDNWKHWNRGYNLNTKGVFVDNDFCNSCGGRNCIC
jgi:hypothetical protein